MENSPFCSPFNKSEVKSALFAMGPWKAPGPYGFPAGFYQGAWDTVGDSLFEFALNTWLHPDNIHEVNLTDICLVPKVSKPISLGLFLFVM